VLATYRALFEARGAVLFCLAGFLARVTMSTVGLGIVLVLSRRGSYGLASEVAATYSLVAGLAAPQVGRLADRYGQSRVLPVSASLLGVGLGALVASTAMAAPTWTLFCTAAVAGCGNASAGSLVRARWAALYTGSPRLHTAYSLESVIDELIFISGPIAITLLTTEVNPVAGLLAALATAVTGLVWLAAQRTTQPPPGQPPDGRHLPMILLPNVGVLALVMVALGAMFGSVDVITVAFVSRAGHRPLAGFVLAGWALGSAVAGLAYGALRLRSSSLRRRFLGCVSGMFLGTVLLQFPTTIAPLAALLFVCGLATAPTLVSSVGLVEATVPRRGLTEAISWTLTAVTLGATAGTALGGVAVDSIGPHRAFVVPLLASALGLTVAMAGARWLRAPAQTGS
jgi:MFS family permease